MKPELKTTLITGALTSEASEAEAFVTVTMPVDIREVVGPLPCVKEITIVG